MFFTISDNVFSEFLSGIVAVSSLIGLGAFLMLLLVKMENRFPFTRLALALALSPLCLVRFLDVDDPSIVNLYAMIVVLLGITIDGIRHLLASKTQPKPVVAEAKKEDVKSESKPGLIVWEKAE